MAEIYLNEYCANGYDVKLFTVNGFLLSGKIVDYDNECVILLSGGKKKLIFKHAISTIEPSKNENTA